MDYFELEKISTRHLELTSPTAPEKLWTIGQYLELNKDKRVIDFGCGYGRTLKLWAVDFGISGIGVEIHPYLCERAKERMVDSDVADRIDIVCANSLEYNFDPNAFDVANCLGASFIWGGFRQALRRMKRALNHGGKIVIGEPYYTRDKVPQALVKFEGDLHTEYLLTQIIRYEGFDVEFVVRASRDDWDRYRSASWFGLLQWIDEHPDHPERRCVIEYLHKNQDAYFRYQKEYEEWAIFILNRVKY